jgi:glycine/D-amino acid oxidase-like deaminating enzyme
LDLRTGAAFWPLKNGLIGVYPPLERRETCDVAVIGAGVSGALVAQRLAEAGCDLVVVDRDDVAMGSTAATTGLLQYETDTSLTELAAHFGVDRAVRSWKLGQRAIDDIEALCSADGCGLTRRPSLYLASSRWDLSRLKVECELRARHGFDVTWLDQKEIAATYGFRHRGAIRSGGAAEIDAYQLTHTILKQATGRGARVYDRTEVIGFRADADGVMLETNRDRTIRARRVVVAAGYEVARRLRKARGHLHSTWACVSEPVANLSWWPGRCLIWETSRPYTYLRTTSDCRVMIGGEDEPWSSRHENTRLLSKKAKRLLAQFSRLFPEAQIELAYAWAGVFGTTPDGLPYVGAVRDHPHTWYALGYGGNGITRSMIAADLIRDWWSGRSNPDAELFSFER